MKVLGIYRENIYSNNAIDADHGIMDSVIDACATFALVDVISPEIFLQKQNGHYYDVIFSMAESADVLNKLAILERQGVKIFNSVSSILNCFRMNMSRILTAGTFPYPPYILGPISQRSMVEVPWSEYWVKRADFHALCDEDVCFGKGPEDLKVILKKFQSRGISDVMIQQHIPGNVYKFYGVTGLEGMGSREEDFFHLRIMKGDRRPPSHCTDRIKKLAFEAAQRMDLNIFGGDVVLDSSENVYVIDINDWPSFRTCQKEAGKVIGQLAFNLSNDSYLGAREICL